MHHLCDQLWIGQVHVDQHEGQLTTDQGAPAATGFQRLTSPAAQRERGFPWRPEELQTVHEQHTQQVARGLPPGTFPRGQFAHQKPYAWFGQLIWQALVPRPRSRSTIFPDQRVLPYSSQSGLHTHGVPGACVSLTLPVPEFFRVQ
ncbi:hypothetical protein D3C81_1638100 [compost metagenome]